MTQVQEREPIPPNYRFIYGGELLEETKLNSNPNVLVLYRRRMDEGTGPWCVVVDFPKPTTETFEATRFCSSFFNLLGLIKEREAIDRYNKKENKPGDDLLIFQHSLRTDEEPDICQGERSLIYKRWDYELMGLFMEARKPLPYYDCPKCRKSERAGNYSKMTGLAIAFIGEEATRFKDENDIYWGIVRPEEIDGMLDPFREESRHIGDSKK